MRLSAVQRPKEGTLHPTLAKTNEAADRGSLDVTK